jgi:hypothetical protein
MACREGRGGEGGEHVRVKRAERESSAQRWRQLAQPHRSACLKRPSAAFCPPSPPHPPGPHLNLPLHCTQLSQGRSVDEGRPPRRHSFSERAEDAEVGGGARLQHQREREREGGGGSEDVEAQLLCCARGGRPVSGTR